MNLIEKLQTLNRLAERYDAKTDIDLIGRKSVIVTLKPGPYAGDLVNCLFQELINFGVFGHWQMVTEGKQLTVDLAEMD